VLLPCLHCRLAELQCETPEELERGPVCPGERHTVSKPARCSVLTLSLHHWSIAVPLHVHVWSTALPDLLLMSVSAGGPMLPTLPTSRTLTTTAAMTGLPPLEAMTHGGGGWRDAAAARCTSAATSFAPTAVMTSAAVLLLQVRRTGQPDRQPCQGPVDHRGVHVFQVRDH